MTALLPPRLPLRTALGLLAALLAPAARAATTPAAPRPNVLLIVTDDQGPWDLGSAGNPHLDTPHLDALAREGQAILLVSHQLNLVARFADHIVLLHKGRVAADGAPSDVMRGEILERVYEWPLVVSRDPAVGAPVLVPLRGRGTR